MTTPRLGAPELVTSQANKEETVNEQVRYLEAGAGHFIFKDRDLATPPGSPADGDCYLVAGSPTGTWTGHAGSIAYFLNTAWVFIAAREGFTAWVNDENLFIGYDGAAWSTLSSPSGVYQPLDADLTTIAGLVDPNADRILFWDDSAGAYAYLAPGSGISITTTTISATGSGGDLLAANNLSDLASAATARANLGLLRLVGTFFTTTPTASEVLAIYVAADAFTLAANLSGSQVSVGTNPTATFAIDVQKNGSTIATVSISTGGAATLTTVGGTSKAVAAGDIIKLVAPATPDATCADVAVTLKGTL